jgi:hypothetical protein
MRRAVQGSVPPRGICECCFECFQGESRAVLFQEQVAPAVRGPEQLVPKRAKM